MAGGRAVRTPFGNYYGTNITPDPLHGIGSWSDEDFIRAMTEGLSPDGKHYFPVFPYTSFTRMKKDDLLHLKDYLFSLPAVKMPNREHDVTFPFNWRGALDVWKKLFFNPGPFKADRDRSESWNRGAYISEALAHCGECHTPRSMMGALDSSMHFAGSLEGPEGELSPNITQDRETGIGEWSRGDLTWLLKTGMKPGGDDVQGLMAEAIESGYRHLTDYDLEAIAEYLESVPPVRNDLESEKKETGMSSEKSIQSFFLTKKALGPLQPAARIFLFQTNATVFPPRRVTNSKVQSSAASRNSCSMTRSCRMR